MHYYKKNIGDYHKKAGRLSMLQHGSYTLLIDSCYDREKFPTLEEAIDWTWASSKEEIEAVEFVLRKFFMLEDGVYVQSRIKEEIDAYKEKSITNKRIALEREAKRKEKPTKRARSVDTSSPVEHEPPPNQEPLTKNQEPITNLTRTSSSALGEAIPEDWFPSSEVYEALMKMHGIPSEFIDDELIEFRVYWKDRRESRISWNSNFLKRVASQWQRKKYTWKSILQPGAGHGLFSSIGEEAL